MMRRHVAVRDDLLDMYRWWQHVERKMGGIDHADAADRHEPDSPVAGLRDDGAVAAGKLMAQHAVRRLEYRRADLHGRVLSRSVQLRSGNVYQAARHVEPDAVAVVFGDPVNRVARQTVPCGEHAGATVFDAAQSSFRSHPERVRAV